MSDSTTQDATPSSDIPVPAGDPEAVDADLLECDHLVTGFPGFIASRMLREILAYEPSGTFYFVVEERFRAQAERRLGDIERSFPEFAGNWEVVVGDITDEYLGVDDSTYRELTETIGAVWHLAAIYDLAVAEAVAYRVNVRGTIHVLDFCERCEDFKRFNYISTCYVSGQREGLVYEDELDEGQGHKNHYESTKFWAEVEVQRRWMNIPTAIFRPGIVVGDSETGETDKYDGPYYLFKFLKKLPNWMPVPNIGRGSSVVNLVPVDFCTEALAYIGLQQDADGDVYQLADPNPMRARDIFSLAMDCMDRAPAVGTIPSGVVEAALSNETVEAKLGVPEEVIVYFNHGARYDSSNTQRALQDTSIRVPHLSTYMQTLVDYFLRHPESPR